MLVTPDTKIGHATSSSAAAKRAVTVEIVGLRILRSRSRRKVVEHTAVAGRKLETRYEKS